MQDNFVLREQLAKIKSMQKFSDAWFTELYLKYGSVEEAIRSYPDSLPISIANYHRLVKKYGLIKSAGRHVSLPETLHFFREKAFEPGTPLERIYAQMPPSFQTSLSTLHRIYQYMEKAVVRRHAAALITTAGNSGEVLVGREVFGNSRYGKKVGDISLPMSFAKKDESNFDSALRVLQQEVFAHLAASGELKRDSTLVKRILSKNIEPVFYFDIVDVRVQVYEIILPTQASEFSSFKLVEHKYENLHTLSVMPNLRTGIGEILKLYGDYLYKPLTLKVPTYHVSSINLALAWRESE